MKIGTVFFWDNLQVDLSGKIKSRWFIYLGKTPYGIDPPRSHLGTTTTQLRYYGVSGYRQHNITLRFSAGESGFEQDCILDIDKDIHSELTLKLENNSNIIIKGHLKKEKLEKLYDLIKSSNRIDKYGVFTLLR